MMSVLEYSEDINKNVEEVLKICSELNIIVSSENDFLDEENIIVLDNYFSEHSEESNDETFEETNETYIEVETEEPLVKAKTVSKKKKVKQDKTVFQKAKKDIYKNKKEKLISNESDSSKIIFYEEGMTIKSLAEKLKIESKTIVQKLFMNGIICNINSPINFEDASIIALDYNKELKLAQESGVHNFENIEIQDIEEHLNKRPPIVTIMGHVDHGKTTLLDTIRKTSVVESEAGGITQTISAYQVVHDGEKITFIDTPGHAAFTAMRARGAQVTDIIIIIVAADDGVMPQTIEAINHAKAANVPILVAINKIDKPGANVDKTMQTMAEYNLVPDEWGGDVLYSKIVATTGEGVDELLSQIQLIAELGNYKSNPKRYASGTVIESRLDKRVGSVVTLIVENGTLRIGDHLVVGTNYAKVRGIKDDKNHEIVQAEPGQPVEITGVSGVPVAGDKFMAFSTEKQAKIISAQRKEDAKTRNNTSQAISMEDLFAKVQAGLKEINLIIKTDVHGSGEAIKQMIEKLELDEVKIKVISTSVGNITENDIILAKASKAIIIGFNLKTNSNTKALAKDNNVEIKEYDIIYKIMDDLEKSVKGMTDPVFEEKVMGTAEVRKLFTFSKVGVIAGSMVTSGIIKSKSKARVIRNDEIVCESEVASIQREKDSVKEVKKGFECGITILDYDDILEGDIIESYEMVEVKK